jgi:predicted metal-binding protein
VSKYKRFFLIYSKFDLENHIKEVKAKHPKRSEYRIKLAFQMKNLFREDLDEEFAKYLENFDEKYEERLLLYDGTCRICLNKEEGGCTFDDGLPCRYPNKRKYSMEAVGIEVIRSVHQLQKKNKIDIEYPSNKYSYRFGLACFK